MILFSPSDFCFVFQEGPPVVMDQSFAFPSCFFPKNFFHIGLEVENHHFFPFINQ